MQLYLNNIFVKLGGKTVIKGVNLEVDQGELVLLSVPTAQENPPLLHTIIGDPRYRLVSGSILFDGRDLTGLRMEEIVRLGLGLNFQIPPRLRGV
ncbi:MAG: hypothetical protein ACUVQ0_00445 [Thermoproteota archaeon]